MGGSAPLEVAFPQSSDRESLAYTIPIVDYVLRASSGRGIQAIVVYPRDALANSQKQELEKFLGVTKPQVTCARYTGQETNEERDRIQRSHPDILLTNFVMLEYLLTRPYDRKLVEAAQGLRFLVLDELYTYRGRQGADVAMLVRRVRERLGRDRLLCVGTSATMSSRGSHAERQAEVGEFATLLFGVTVEAQNLIGETLSRRTSQGKPPGQFDDRSRTAHTDATRAGVIGEARSHSPYVLGRSST